MPTRQSTAETLQHASLPQLNTGITLLTVDSTLRHAIHALAVDHVLLESGDACWIDTGTHAQTGPLRDVAPSRRILNRVHVARGFTPFQHLDLLRSLPDMCTDQTELVVAPHLDAYYRDDDLLADEGRDMLLSGIASLARVARANDIPVLVTTATTDAFSYPITNAATQTLDCEATPFGPRFRADDAETLVYPAPDGQWVQTTLAFWEDVLSSRQSLYQHPTRDSHHEQEVTAHGAN